MNADTEVQHGRAMSACPRADADAEHGPAAAEEGARGGEDEGGDGAAASSHGAMSDEHCPAAAGVEGSCGPKEGDGKEGGGGGGGCGCGSSRRLLRVLAAAVRRVRGCGHHLSRARTGLSQALRRHEECALCCAVVLSRRCHSNPCGHRCCEACWRAYLATDAPAAAARMRHARAYTLVCPWAPASCDAPLERKLVSTFGPAQLVATVLALQRRDELIARAADAGCRWLECPAAGCVGVGYDDGVQQLAMCFICEEQFTPPPRGLLHAAGSTLYAWLLSWWPERIDGVTGWRPCPHCGAAILKDGGCDNMRCGMCQRTFRWGPRRNSTEGVTEAHAPPPRHQSPPPPSPREAPGASGHFRFSRAARPRR